MSHHASKECTQAEKYFCRIIFESCRTIFAGRRIIIKEKDYPGCKLFYADKTLRNFNAII
jgi:hypothetical protein